MRLGYRTLCECVQSDAEYEAMDRKAKRGVAGVLVTLGVVAYLAADLLGGYWITVHWTLPLWQHVAEVLR